MQVRYRNQALRPTQQCALQLLLQRQTLLEAEKGKFASLWLANMDLTYVEFRELCVCFFAGKNFQIVFVYHVNYNPCGIEPRNTAAIQATRILRMHVMAMLSKVPKATTSL